MVFAPVAIILGLSLNTRVQTHAFEPIASTPMQDKQVTAYRAVLRHSLEATAHRREASPDRLRAVGAEWVRGAAEGTLRPLEPVYYGDTMEESVKEQILAAQEAVIRRLVRQALREAEAKRYEQAAQDVMLSLEVARVLKYSDFSSLVLISTRSGRGYSLIGRVLPHLGAGTRAELARRLRALQQGSPSVASMAKRARRQFLEYRAQQEIETPSIEETEPVAHAAERGQSVSRTMLASTDDDPPAYISDARLAVITQRDEARRVARLLAKLTQNEDRRHSAGGGPSISVFEVLGP